LKQQKCHTIFIKSNPQNRHLQKTSPKQATLRYNKPKESNPQIFTKNTTPQKTSPNSGENRKIGNIAAKTASGL